MAMSMLAQVAVKKQQILVGLIEKKLEAVEQALTTKLEKNLEDVSFSVNELATWAKGSVEKLDGFQEGITALNSELEELALLKSLLEAEDSEKEELGVGETLTVNQELASGKSSVTAAASATSLAGASPREWNEPRFELTLKSVEFSEGDDRPDPLILQGSKQLKYRSESLMMRFGLAWDFDSSIWFFVCLPEHAEKDGQPPYYGDYRLKITLPASGPDGKPVIHEDLMESSNGTCSYPAEASDIEHLDCDRSTYCNQVLQSPEEIAAFKKSLEDPVGTSAFYSLTVTVELIPCSTLEHDEEHNVEMAMAMASSEPDMKQGQEVALPNENEIPHAETPKSVLVIPRFARVRPAVDDPPPTAPEHDLVNKLSKPARVAYEIWWAGDGLDNWAQDIQVLPELLQLGFRANLSKLVEDVVRHLEVLPDHMFTMDLAVGLLADAAMHGLNATELLRRAGRVISEQRSPKKGL